MPRKDADERRAYMQEYRLKNAEHIRQYRQGYGPLWYEMHIEQEHSRQREYNIKLKMAALEHYSKFPVPTCAHCEETDLRVLTLDHIEGNGAEMKRQLGWQGRGTPFYRWLKKNGYPPGYQVLCMNCQWKKRYDNEEYKR